MDEKLNNSTNAIFPDLTTIQIGDASIDNIHVPKLFHRSRRHHVDCDQFFYGNSSFGKR